MNLLRLDTETFSPFDVTVVGVAKYCTDVEVIMASYAWNDDPVHLWEFGDDPDHFLTLLHEADRLIAHNAWFDRSVLEAVGWCDRPLDDWHCTMAQALAHSLPGSLDALGRRLGLDPKDLKKEGGKKLMRLFCKPQPKTGVRLYPKDLPEQWDQFCTYGVNDTVALREIHKRMPRLNLHECC